MKGAPQGIYSQELREEAMRLIREGGLSAPEVGRRLSIPTSTIRYWMGQDTKGKVVGLHQKPHTDTELEVVRLKKELRQVTMERDLLKKAAAYFAKESLEGTRS
jgi:transposase